MLQQRHASASSLHFVEDKLGTLDKVVLGLSAASLACNETQGQPCAASVGQSVSSRQRSSVAAAFCCCHAAGPDTS